MNPRATGHAVLFVKALFLGWKMPGAFFQYTLPKSPGQRWFRPQRSACAPARPLRSRAHEHDVSATHARKLSADSIARLWPTHPTHCGNAQTAFHNTMPTLPSRLRVHSDSTQFVYRGCSTLLAVRRTQDELRPCIQLSHQLGSWLPRLKLLAK